jgi:hypothetical protein
MPIARDHIVIKKEATVDLIKDLPKDHRWEKCIPAESEYVGSA